MKNISAAILCGGKSTRIGKFKPFLEINGDIIIEKIITTLKQFFSEIIISANKKDYFKKYNLKVFEDIIPNKDIFGGIYTILKNISTDYVFIVPCDMPFLDPELIKFTLSQNFYNYDILFYAIKGRFQPLFGIYHKNCVKFFEDAVKQTNFPRLMDITNLYKTLIISEKDIPSSINIEKAFFNINTEEDYYKAQNNQFKEIPILGIVAKYSNSGKTTLIEKLIEQFKKEKFKVGVLKHTVHTIEIDKKGKDTYRFYEKGADTIIIDTYDQIVIRKRLNSPVPVKYIKDTYFKDVDIVLVEGHKGGNFPKIEIIKKEQDDFLYTNDSNIIAVITEKKILTSLKIFQPNDIQKIYNFIKESLNLN